MTSDSAVKVEITSFSYKDPLPEHLFSWNENRHGGGFVFDCRSLPNPGREEKFKLATGCDAAVRGYLENVPEVSLFREQAFGLVENAVKNFIERKFSYISVGFGCTGGQHRSVYFAETLTKYLHDRFGESVSIVIHHPSLVKKGLLK